MDWLRVILSLVGIIGLIFMLFYAIRKLNKAKLVTGGGKMHILDRINLGKDGMLLVVSVCGKLMLIGAGAGRIEKLCDLDMTEAEYFPDGQTAPDFKSVLSNMMGKSKSEAATTDAEQKVGEGEQDA